MNWENNLGQKEITIIPYVSRLQSCLHKTLICKDFAGKYIENKKRQMEHPHSESIIKSYLSKEIEPEMLTVFDTSQRRIDVSNIWIFQIQYYGNFCIIYYLSLLTVKEAVKL